MISRLSVLLATELQSTSLSVFPKKYISALAVFSLLFFLSRKSSIPVSVPLLSQEVTGKTQSGNCATRTSDTLDKVTQTWHKVHFLSSITWTTAHLLMSSCRRSSKQEAGTRTALTPVFPCQAMPLGSCLPAGPPSKISVFDVKQFRTESQGIMQTKSRADVSSFNYQTWI